MKSTIQSLLRNIAVVVFDAADKIKPTANKQKANDVKWELWFAWHPVRLATGERVWLEAVSRLPISLPYLEIWIHLWSRHHIAFGKRYVYANAFCQINTTAYQQFRDWRLGPPRKPGRPSGPQSRRSINKLCVAVNRANIDGGGI